jgi:signal transduction histidine kinase
MNIEPLVNIQYCYDYLINQIPVGLLLYSHIPTAIAALFFGGFVLYKVRRLPSLTLFIVCVSFAAWCLFDLGSWFSFLGSAEMMFMWSLLDLIALIFFCFAYYFLYTFITGRDVPAWQKAIGTLLVLPTAVTTLLGLNLTAFDANICEAWEHAQITFYPYVVEAIVLLAAISLTAYHYAKAEKREHKKEILLAGIGVNLFLGFFFSATLAVALLVNYDISEYAYNFEIYGLFGMPILLMYLGFLIVRYHAFDLRVFGAQALVLALVALIGSEFAFVDSIVNQVLVAITLVLTGLVGMVLVRSVRREIQQRERIEELARELEKSNKQQVTLIHFITHQLKGFMSKSRNIFSMVLEGEFGQPPETMKPMLEEGLRSGTKGAQTIEEILNAANIKSGKVTYAKEPVDLKELVGGIVADLTPNAEAKGIALTFAAEGEGFTLAGDSMQLTNAFKNLIDNALKYTPQGRVQVSLARNGDTIRLMTEDTGVGITPEDMEHLFTEGGHGKESRKVNVESTGFGLYIVKNIIDAHGGSVRAESEGAGKGSRFVVELPAVD